MQQKLELSADEDFVLTAWQYRMLQRDVAASKGKYLPAKRQVRNTFRTAALEAMAQRDDDDWSPVVAAAVDRIAPASAAPAARMNADASGPDSPQTSACCSTNSASR